jgi:hypothetical protein
MSIEKRAKVDLVANRRHGVARNPLEDSGAIIQRFLATEPRATMQMDALCRDFCPSCTETRDPGERRQLCTARRCGLLDVARFNQEKLVIVHTLHRLVHMESAEAADVDNFNQHIAQAGSATLAMVQGESGHYRLGWNVPTLRAAIHAAVLVRLSIAAGDLGSVHAEEVSGAQADETIRQGRAWREGLLRQRVISLYQEAQPGQKPISIRELARRVERKENTVRKWLREARLL